MSHTKEPWTAEPDEEALATYLTNSSRQNIAQLSWTTCDDATREEVNANATRIVAAVNGCAGLNPAAFREVVEALRHFYELSLTRGMMGANLTEAQEKAKQALAAAQEVA